MPPETENSSILFRCYRCKIEKLVPRVPDDPRNATVVYTFCPQCVQGGFDQTNYFDAQGRELYGDPLSKDWGKPLEDLRNAPCDGK